MLGGHQLWRVAHDEHFEVKCLAQGTIEPLQTSDLLVGQRASTHLAVSNISFNARTGS